ncbi:DUF4197 domain-containing protein [Rhodoferax sp.]|uniref:DUF4197 domain-containing protein n=1 Tax=Rhodoferax sp. TaxID=50421 RepID=UPI00260FE6A6|nr:DUF4197 domain-containing protein [Rhodoferax sp.]MDD5480599.1 DUF4197 domain-containing protein [Rhodoferax sp.]
MNRRSFCCAPIVLSLTYGVGFHGLAQSLTLSDITNAQASSGLKVALEKGALSAVNILGQVNGFMGNEQVRIPLPGYLEDAAKLMRTFGQGAKLDELVTAMNQAAEKAVPLARDTLIGAVKSINVQDAKKILMGSDTAVTQFFAEKTRQPLHLKFLPIVTQTTARANLSEKYNQIAARAAGLGLIKSDQSTIQNYVTEKALDGLYFIISEEEKKIRQDPVGTGSAILNKVFGALKNS